MLDVSYSPNVRLATTWENDMTSIINTSKIDGGLYILRTKMSTSASTLKPIWVIWDKKKQLGPEHVRPPS